MLPFYNAFKGRIGMALILILSSFVSIGQRAGDIDRTFNYGRGTNYSYLIGTGPNSTINLIQPSGSNHAIIMGGFLAVHGLEKYKNLARVNTTTGELDTTFFFSGFSGQPFQVIPDSGKTLIVGSLNPVNNNNIGIARFNADGTYETAFNIGRGPETFSAGAPPMFFPITFNGALYSAVRLNDGRLLLGGSFNRFNSNSQVSGLAMINRNRTLDVNYRAGSTVTLINRIIKLKSGKLLVAGTFTNLLNRAISGVARLNADGTIDNSFNVGGTGSGGSVSWVDTNANGQILISGGSLNAYNGTTVKGIALLDSSGALVSSFFQQSGTPSTIDITKATFLKNGKIALYGLLSTFNGTGTNRIVILNSDGTRDTQFTSPTLAGVAGQVIHVHELPNGNLMLGCAGNGTTFLTVITQTGAGVSSFLNYPGIRLGGLVGALVSGNDYIVHGQFQGIEANISQGIAKINSNGEFVNSFVSAGITGQFSYNIWKARTNASGDVYLAGQFNSVGGVAMNGFAKLNPDGSRNTSFSSTGNNAFGHDIIEASDGNVWLCGQFTTLNGSNQIGYAIVNKNTGAIIPGFTGSAGNVNTYPLSFTEDLNNKMMVGGAFTTINGSNINRLARLSLAGVIDPTFNVGTGFDGNVREVFPLKNGKYLCGGEFSNFNGQAASRLVMLNSDGSRDNSFIVGTGFTRPSGGAIIWDIKPWKGGKWLISGNFTAYNGNAAQNLVMLNSDGTYDPSFDTKTGTNGTIYNIMPDTIANRLMIFTGSNIYKNLVINGYAKLLMCETPVAPTITSANGTNICPGQTITLQGPAGKAGYQWSNGETTQNITVSTAGSYTLRYFNDGCISHPSAAIVLTADPCVNPVNDWVGGVSSDWFNPANWANNQVPTATTHAKVSTSAVQMPVINANASVANFEMTPGTSLNLGTFKLNVKGTADLSGVFLGTGTVSLNGSGSAQNLIGNNLIVPNLELDNASGINMTGDVSITGGLLLKSGTVSNGLCQITLKSNSTGTAYLDNFSSGYTGTLSNAISIERYSEGGYRHVGAPLAGQNISTLGVSCILVRSFDEPSNSWIPMGMSCGTQSFNAAGGISFNAGSATNNPTTVTFTGSPVSGTVNFNLVRTPSVTGGPQTGWNSLYNPYPSPIDWNVIKNLGSNGIITNRAVWIWNSTLNNWATLTGLGVATNGASNVIATGQGFLVRRLTNGVGGPAFTINNSCRLPLYTNQFLREGNANTTLKFSIKGEGNSDEAVILLDPYSIADLDENDAERPIALANSIELSTLSNSGEKLMVNAINSQELLSSELDLAISLPKEGNYHLMLTENSANLSAYIKDVVRGTITAAEQGISLSTSAKTEFSGRYKLVFSQSASNNEPTFKAWGINSNRIIAQVNENAGLELFDALGRSVPYNAEKVSESHIALNLKGSYTGVLFVKCGNKTEKVILK